jgi:hypothetical protein
MYFDWHSFAAGLALPISRYGFGVLRQEVQHQGRQRFGWMHDLRQKRFQPASHPETHQPLRSRDPGDVHDPSKRMSSATLS